MQFRSGHATWALNSIALEYAYPKITCLALGVCIDAERLFTAGAPSPSLGVCDMPELRTVGLFLVTALAEIVGCYLPYLWLREGKTVWLLVPGALSLAAFVWLLSLHPTAAGRVYAAYGGVYIFMAIVWLWGVDGIRPSVWDLVGSAVALAGMAIIMFAPRTT